MPSLYDLPRFYDAIYASDHATAFYADVSARGRSVLELACGSGRITFALAATGLAVTGLDASRPMLDAARAKPGAASITWVEADMTTFDLGSQFDTIMIANNSLLHVHATDDLIRCFERVRAHLAPNGSFVFDVFNPSMALLAQRPSVRHRFAEFANPEHGTVVVESTTDYDAAAQVNRATLYFSTAAKPDFVVVPLHLRSIFPLELPLLLERAGLVLESRIGGFDGGAFDRNSRHQVCTCRA